MIFCLLFWQILSKKSSTTIFRNNKLWITRAVIFKRVDSRQLGIITSLIIWFLDADQRLLTCTLIFGYQILLSTIKVFLSFKWKKFNFVKQISDLILCIVVLNWTKVHEWLINGGLNSRLYGCAILLPFKKYLNNQMEMTAVVVVMSSLILFFKIFWFDVQKVSKSKIWKWILSLIMTL